MPAWQAAEYLAADVIRIGIFTKMNMAGGSEFRAAEMATALSDLPDHQAVLLVEKTISPKLRSAIGGKVEIHESVFGNGSVEAFYSVDHLLVINSDSRDFTTSDYWQGRTPHHACAVDLARIKQMVFLFNFLVSPARHLAGIRALVPDVRIITANAKFFHEISEQSRYEPVRHYPRMQLESPINPAVAQPKSASTRLRFGMHSLAAASKWNDQWSALIERINRDHQDRVSWDFMGMPKAIGAQIHANNVRIRKEFAVPVAEFLRELDVFVFFTSWKREEPWARSAAEALMSGCPVVATGKGGNGHQVIHGNTGFLCKNLEDFAAACQRLIESPEILAAMRANAQALARQFTSAEVMRKFLQFIQ